MKQGRQAGFFYCWSRLLTLNFVARVDGLSKREESATEMTEHFINRPDFLFYRHVKFGVREKKVAPATLDGFPRPILVSNYANEVLLLQIQNTL